MSKARESFGLLLKGMAMGAADVVPGVSGGTIAFITGIYEELIATISSIGVSSVRTLFKEGPRAFWKAVNGNFLLALVVGIAISIFSLARIISSLLENHPVLVWAFFFGLVAASIPVVGRRVKVWGATTYFAFAVGAISAFLVTQLPAIDEPGALWYLFISGAIAICAMILPGISGSFILLLLGSYLAVLDAVNERDFVALGIFMAGAVVGLLSFSNLLKWMFKRYEDLTIALLSGFLLGSLNKLWPWKGEIKSVIKHPGTPKERKVVLEDELLWPWNYDGTPYVWAAIGMAIGGALLIFVIDRLAAKNS